MRHRSSAPPPSDSPRQGSDWQTLKSLLPYLWAYKGRVTLALLCLVGAKLANVGVPLVLKHIIDALTPQGVLQLPILLLLAYGALRLSTSVFTELRELLFARVTQRAVRRLALQVFEHLHRLSLRFHLDRQTGGMTRDIERGTRGIASLVSYTLYSILPTLIEMALVIGYLLVQYDIAYAAITAGALSLYIVFTITVTEWRTHYRRTMNDLDSKANVRAVDSLLNYETVKYFSNETFEAQRYDASLANWETAAVRSQRSLSLLNMGQSAIIAIAVSLVLWRATTDVAAGRLSLGDLVLINAFMIQLYIPLNFLGVIYREIKQSLADIDRMFGLLHQHREVADARDAADLRLQGAALRFEKVNFSYDGRRQVLFDVDFSVAAGQTVAVVGESGSGKSTLARLLFRFYDVTGGAILLDGQDIRSVTQSSLRRAIGIVPQDTVLFNDSIEYNIAYGQPGASRVAVEGAARAAHIADFVAALPDGFATTVGERGLKLSGGEKQRVAIARTILKDPALLIFDEATSALDSQTEQIIQRELEQLATQRTTLIIAHRLSTIVHADQILVMNAGRIVERGTHAELLQARGTYARMWLLQQAESG
ncbi:MAG: ABCB family ABC transporter ATP-binding protein/permease [Burkholderiaceae bacterium]